MLFHRISICLSVAALMTCAGCGRHKSDLAKSDPFLNSTPPAASVAEKSDKSRTGVLQAGKSAKDEAGTKTANTHETFNRAAAARFEEDGVPSRPGSRDLTASKSPGSTPSLAAKPAPPTQKLPGAKPLAQTAFNPNESPDFDDEEPEMKPLYERTRPASAKKANVELVASSAPAEGDEAAPFPEAAGASRPAKPAASAKKNPAVASAAKANPFEDDDSEPTPSEAKHPLEQPAAESVAAREEETSDTDHEFGAAPKTAAAASPKTAATPSRNADPFADDPFSESAFKSTAADTAGSTRGGEESEWAEAPTAQSNRTVTQKPVSEPASKTHPTAADYDDEDQFSALRQAGHQKPTTSRPAAKPAPEPTTAAKPDADANPFADLGSDTAPKSKSSEAKAAEWFDSAKEAPKPTRTAAIDRKAPPADPFAEEEEAPKTASRPQLRTAAKPAAHEPSDEDEGARPYVRSVKSQPAPQVEEEMAPPEEEPEGRVRLDDTISRTSYEFEARPPKKQPTAAPATKASTWKARPAAPAVEGTPAPTK
jgi:hypothetical protein